MRRGNWVYAMMLVNHRGSVRDDLEEVRIGIMGAGDVPPARIPDGALGGAHDAHPVRVRRKDTLVSSRVVNDLRVVDVVLGFLGEREFLEARL